MGVEIGKSYSFILGVPWVEQNRDDIFKGSLAEWARERRELFLERTEPMHLFFGQKEGQMHTVAWLLRSGINPESGEPYWFFHAACDCMPEAEVMEEPDIMFGCNVLAESLIERASIMGSKFAQQDPGQAIVDVLEQDRQAPYSWVANYISGQHELSMLALMLRENPDDIAEVASDLSSFGVVELEGETLRLAA